VDDRVMRATTMVRMVGLSWAFSCVQALARSANLVPKKS